MMRRYAVTVSSDYHNVTWTRRFFTRYFANRYANLFNRTFPTHYHATRSDDD